MVERINRVNFHFEEQLYNANWRSQCQKWEIQNRELEYLYFFCSNEPLLTQTNYPTEYLEKLHKLGFPANYTSIESGKQIIDWWGSLENPLIERVLNDKLSAVKCREELGLFSHSRYVENKVDFLAAIGQLEGFCYIRSRHGQAGKQLKRFASNVDLEQYLLTPQFFKGPFGQALDQGKGLILGEWKIRIIDIGSRYWLAENNSWHWISLVDEFGIYRGGVYFASQNLLKKVCQSCKFEIEQMVSDHKRVLEYYQTRFGLQDTIQFDSFSTSDTQVSFQEANHRRTMGDVMCSLGKRYVTEGFGLFLLEKKPDSTDIALEGKMIITNEQSQIIKLTPPGENYKFESFFIPINNLDTYKTNQKLLEHVFSKNPILLKAIENIF